MANFGKPRPEPVKKSPYLPFDHGTPDGYDFFLKLGPLANADVKYFKGEVAFWNEALKHPNYDAFWQARNVRRHLKDIKPAVLTVGGWFDAENLFGALETFKKVEANRPPAANHLVMGPWVHGGWGRAPGDALGPVTFNAKTSEYYREQVILPFFEHHLKDKDDPKLPKALAFETGTNRWRRFDAWPPKEGERRTLYFHPDGKLAFAPPADADAAADEFVSDPAKPVPYFDKITVGMDKEYMVGDQRSAGRRPDVLAYATDVLTEDVTVAGPVEAELFVSTTGTDADWVVKLIDVYPDDLPDPDPNPTGVRLGGYQQLVRGDVMRGRFRESPERPEPFEPGRPTRVKFALPDTSHTFRTGHRIMVQVQSTWFPLVDRNPQTFVDNIAAARPDDFRKATHRVHRGGELRSRVVVRVVK
jgi:putative CocE/NonD family hydrolase